MISRCPRVFALALASTMVLAACTSEDETEATGSDESALTPSSLTGFDESEESEESGGASVSPSAIRDEGAGRDGASCAKVLATDLGAATEDLLFPSESDYPFETVDLEDLQGAGAITPARLLALLALDPQTRTETRRVDALFADLLAGSEGARYQAVLDTLKSELTDLAVIRIVPAAPSSAQIRVYVVGRTACDEIAGITTISIET
jgi:hypothetical protein